MAKFNPNDYETVAERIARFYGDWPNGRITTKNLTTLQDRQVSTWVVQAKVWLPYSEQPDAWYLKATGLAFEVDGGSGANQTSALENAETSAIGRALANAGYSGDKRTTREEMEKVNRGVTPMPAARFEPVAVLQDPAALLSKIESAQDKKALRAIWETLGSQKDHLVFPNADLTFGQLIIEQQKHLPEVAETEMPNA